MPLTYGDQVRIISGDRTPEYADQTGRIVGTGADEGSGASFAVAFADGHTASFWEHEVQILQP